MLILSTFIYLGPTVGTLLGLVSKNRNATGLVDSIAPAAPIFTSVPEATQEEKIVITGLSEPGADVELFVNGPSVGVAIVDSVGIFTFTDIKLIKGNNTIFAKATDSDNNVSDKSETLSIAYDKDAPKIDIISPKSGDTIRNLNQRIIVKGKVNEKSVVRINERTAIVKPDLTFELSLGVEEGNQQIKIIATDPAGNQKEETFSITYVKSS
ncbi:hypothetical protein KC980_01650 [candidate division WWE3 bacterium]|uniref:Bacterial Ig-like domain-containing protein n=1 Tax=candidate division WWE3 bacterium TaxID=2053526 RepID=A0A955J1U8_UNCKA|nr:hypothetical protein [candidate division WWE3 bacterium]